MKRPCPPGSSTPPIPERPGCARTFSPPTPTPATPSRFTPAGPPSPPSNPAARKAASGTASRAPGPGLAAGCPRAIVSDASRSWSRPKTPIRRTASVASPSWGIPFGRAVYRLDQHHRRLGALREGFLATTARSPCIPTSLIRLYAGATNLHVPVTPVGTGLRSPPGRAESELPNYVHADQHAIVVPAPVSSIPPTTAASPVPWTMAPPGKCASTIYTTMFYDMDVSPEDHMVFGGGAQDNGSSGRHRPPLPSHPRRRRQRQLVFDPKRPAHAYAARTDLHS